MDIPAFRAAFPEFADSAVYPSTQIAFWAALAEKQVRLCVWGDCATQGVQLYVAHEITLAAQSAKAAKVGGVPGTQGGIANTKTVGSVTVGYDSSGDRGTGEKDVGWWNLSNYGRQFIRLARIFGAGCAQL